MTTIGNDEQVTRSTDISVESLLQEVTVRSNEGETAPAITCDDQFPHQKQSRPQQVLSYALNTLFSDTDFQFSEHVVKQNLDEVLLMLIALRENGTHGKGLMDDLGIHFQSRLSPGTVYPRLHDLEERGLLDRQEMVRTKEYLIADDEQVRAHLEHAMAQHLTLGYALYLSLGDI
jgi:hypothetical protein